MLIAVELGYSVKKTLENDSEISCAEITVQTTMFVCVFWAFLKTAIQNPTENEKLYCDYQLRHRYTRDTVPKKRTEHLPSYDSCLISKYTYKIRRICRQKR